MANKNKHGLSRRIPKSVKALIRKNSGYGCVICGNAIVEYEHVDPEFKDAISHNASCMTLLCPGCHAKVTKEAFSKSKVKEAMKKPWSFENGMSYDDLELPPQDPKMHIGNSVYSTENVLLRVKGRDLIKFYPPETKNSPYRISAEFYDNRNTLIARIQKNVYESILGEHDVEFVSSRISVKDPSSKDNVLVIERAGGEDLKVLELNMYYEGIRFQLQPDGSLKITTGVSTIIIGRANIAAGKVVFEFN